MVNQRKILRHSFVFWCLFWALFDVLFADENSASVNGNFNQNLPCSNDFQSSPVANCGNSTENYPSFESIFDEKNYYIAAVIDYVAITDAIMNSKMTVMQNLQNYVGIIQECGKFMFDIVVFPECGLHSCEQKNRDSALELAVYVPSPDDHVIPCQQQQPDGLQAVLNHLSCASQKNNIYTALNLMEKFCPNDWTCSISELLLYNTEVIFDRNGTIIARYRKFNLYTERFTYGVNQTKTPEMVTFVTDFGIKFGLMTCFDEFLPYPSVALIEKYNVTHMIHSSAMLSRLPFLAAASLDAGWSYSMNSIVLTASLSSSLAVLGTNIYFGHRESTQSYVKNYGFSKIIVAPVPKDRSVPQQPYPTMFNNLIAYSPSAQKEFIFLVEHKIKEVTLKSLFAPNNQPTATFQYESIGYACNISVAFVDTHSHWPNYKLLAFSGLTNFSINALNNYVEMCGIVLCADSFDNLCHLPPRFKDSSQILFTSVNISAISYAPDEVRIPSTLTSNLTALSNSNFIFSSYTSNLAGKSVNVVDMKLIRPTADLVTFGIYKLIRSTYPISEFDFYDYEMNQDIV